MEMWGIAAAYFKEVVSIVPGEWKNLEDVENAVVWFDSQASALN